MYYGIRGVNLQWFKSHLTNRGQYIKFNYTKYMLHSLFTFLIHINNLPNFKRDMHFILCADDTTVLFPEHNIPRDVNHIQLNINLISH